MIVDQTLPEDITVFKVNRNLTREHANEIRSLFSTHIENRKPSAIVIDLARVDTADSSGLRLIVSFYELLNKAGIKLAFSNLTNSLYDLFRTTKLNHLVPIVSTSEKAREMLNQQINGDYIQS